jgi:outer membrane protein TolC
LDDFNTKGIDIESCIKFALKNSADINFYKSQYFLSELKKNEAAKNLWVPRFDLETTYAPKLDFFGRPIFSENIYTSTFSIEKPIYHGGGLLSALEYEKSESISLQYNKIYKEIEIITDTIMAYFDLLIAQSDFEIKKKYSEYVNESVDILRKKFSKGLTTKLNVLEGDIKLNEIECEVSISKEDLIKAASNLKEKIGFSLVTEIVALNSKKIKPINISRGEISKEILENHPMLKFYEQKIVSSEKLKNIKESKSLPNVDLLGNYRWQGDDFPGDQQEWSVLLKVSFSLGDHSLSLSRSYVNIYENEFNFQPEDSNYDLTGARLSIFERNKNEINLYEAKAEYEYSKDLKNKVQDEMIKNLMNAESDFKKSQVSFMLKQKNTINLNSQFKILENMAKLEQVSILELIEFKEKIIEAELDLLKAKYANEYAKAEVYKALGKLPQWEGN